LVAHREARQPGPGRHATAVTSSPALAGGVEAETVEAALQHIALYPADVAQVAPGAGTRLGPRRGVPKASRHTTRSSSPNRTGRAVPAGTPAEVHRANQPHGNRTDRRAGRLRSPCARPPEPGLSQAALRCFLCAQRHGLGRELRSQYPSLGSTAIAKHGLRQWAAPAHPGARVTGYCRLEPSSCSGTNLWVAATSTISPTTPTGTSENAGRALTPLDAGPSPRTRQDWRLALPWPVPTKGLPEHPSNLPTLFRVDDALALEDGQHWALNCGHSVCQPKDGPRCVYTSWPPHA